MSALPGGAADKLGNRYEFWWTVFELVRMLHGQSESIRIEDPGVTKAEFVVIRLGRRILHQAKRSHPNGKWSLAALGAIDVQLLQAIHAQLLGNDARFVFVSGSHAEELHTLTERAKQSANLSEFESVFVKDLKHKNNFDTLIRFWNNTDSATAYEILQRIEVRTEDERGIEDSVKLAIPSLFLVDPEVVASALLRIAQDSVHKTIARDDLVRQLAEQGYALRKLQRVDDAVILIQKVTHDYLTDARSKLIQGALIPRKATEELLKHCEATGGGADCILAGRAGAGKTGCVIEFVEAVQRRGMVVLAFRLDRVNPVMSPSALGVELGVEDSPALVLQAAAGGREALLVVDQLDAVSTVSGRSVELFDAVEGLLMEVRGLRQRLKLHIVVVCRAFDWENDHRLRRLLTDRHNKVEMGELSVDEVKTVLTRSGFRVELFRQRQLDLLRLPQNLSLFLNGVFHPEETPQFNTAKELFDLYWTEKRHKVAERGNQAPDQWSDVIRVMCDEVTRRQQLSVMREALDPYEAYASRMASEGVLTFDGRRYGFGHESFFDYCFARAFVLRQQSLTDSIAASEQHLFRRAQVRQVLAYLRDADRTRYHAEITKLLADKRIRPHLKDVTLAFVAALPDLADDDWRDLEYWLDANLAALRQGQHSEDRLASMVWQHFFGSETWFHLADSRGILAKWIGTEGDALANIGVNYLRWHQRHSPDRVAELLEPYVGHTGQWPDRFRNLVQWAQQGTSRRFFELVLRLIDDGTLDEARGPIAANSTFLCIFHGLAKIRPNWLAEIVAHWLRRRLTIIRGKPDGDEGIPWSELFNHDNFGRDELHEAAANDSVAFVEHVLPIVLEIIDLAVIKEENEPPRRDRVWPFLMKSEHESIDTALITALAYALRKYAESPGADLAGTIEALQRRETYIANVLLLVLYTGGGTRLAEAAVLLLCREHWRLHCGYTDSPHWIAMELIRTVVPHCSSHSRSELETVILDFTTEYERSTHGFRHAGYARFSLLSCFRKDLLSPEGCTRLGELERKFNAPDSAPKSVRAFWVESPIEKEAAQKMSDEQWLGAIAKYQSEERPHRWDAPEKGGASELASMLVSFVKDEPERFARLCLRLPKGTHPVYISRTLEGLKGSGATADLKLEVCRKAYSVWGSECGKAIADLIGSIEDRLPDDAVQMVGWLATEHPDPEPDHSVGKLGGAGGAPPWGGDIHTHGINTVRGRTAEAIRDLIWQDSEYLGRFRGFIDHLVDDPSESVRSCVISLLCAVATRDIPLALRLFARVITPDDRLLGTPYVERFINMTMRRQFADIRPYIERMLRSVEAKVNEAGARLASLAVLYGAAADDLVAEAISGSPTQRLGVAQVAESNIGQVDCRNWCETQLLTLFNDADARVRREAASCFWQLKKSPLETYENLMRAFCNSAAYGESSSIFHLFEESVHRLPGVTCDVIEKFLERFSVDARDIRTRRAGEVITVAKLLFRTYQQHQGDEWASRCLDLIDRMCLEGIPDVKKGLDEFDR